MDANIITRSVRIPAGTRVLNGELRVPDRPRGLAVFVHGSGSGRLEPDRQLVPRYFEGRGYATLMVDLLTMGEEASDLRSGQYHLNVPFMAERICLTLIWVRRQPDLRNLPVALIGVETAGGAAMVAAAAHPDRIRGVISLSGRPDLAEDALRDVRIPVLLIAGARDAHVVDCNREALLQLHGARLDIVDGAGTLLHGEGGVARAALDAADWLDDFVAASQPLCLPQWLPPGVPAAVHHI
jgi:pimeloyl-ACP methyl ester carboxylesterase